MLSSYKFHPSDSTECYFIKMGNISLFSAYDVNIELTQIERYTTPNGQMNSRLTMIGLVKGDISYIPGYMPSWIRKNAPYALRIRTKVNLENILSDEHKSIKVQVRLRHGLTGLTKVASKEYCDITQIREGKFKYGLKFGSIV